MPAEKAQLQDDDKDWAGFAPSKGCFLLEKPNDDQLKVFHRKTVKYKDVFWSYVGQSAQDMQQRETLLAELKENIGDYTDGIARPSIIFTTGEKRVDTARCGSLVSNFMRHNQIPVIVDSDKKASIENLHQRGSSREM